jgi:cell division protein FtsB
MEPESTFKKAAFGDPRTDAQIRVAKRINTLALIGLIVLLGSTFFYFVRLKNTKVALQDSKTEVEVQKDSLAKLQAQQQRLNEELNSYKQMLEEQRRRTDSTLQALAAKVNANDFKSARTIARDYQPVAAAPQEKAPAQRFVNVYLYQAPEKEAQAIRQYLSEHDYQVLRSSESKTVTRWLDPSSTIEYFKAEDQAHAENLRKELSRITGSEFTIQHTASADPAAEPNWLNITLIGEDGVHELMQMNLQMQQRK